MINYNLSEFNFLKSKKNRKKHKDNIFGVLTIAVSVAFLAGILASNFFYNQMERNLAQIVQERSSCQCDYQATPEERIVQIIEEVSPAVVSIVATKEIPVYEIKGSDFFHSFEQKGTEEQEVGEGTGFIISEDGLVLTNKHVVLDEEANFKILTLDGSEYPVEVIARDPVQDLAVLEIIEVDHSFPQVELGDSSKVKVGQTVIAIGNALGKYQNAVSTGVVSGLGRTVQASGGSFYEVLRDVIQSDTAINKGNSGGPLLNLDGEVIGINTAIDVEGQNIAFAIPINKAKRDVEQIRTTGEIVYPFLGVRYVAVTELLQKQEDLPVDYGALILKGESGESAVIPGSAADKAGIKEGDIILELNDQKIDSDHSLGEEIMEYSPGEEISVKILRNDEEINLKAILEQRNKYE